MSTQGEGDKRKVSTERQRIRGGGGMNDNDEWHGDWVTGFSFRKDPIFRYVLTRCPGMEPGRAIQMAARLATWRWPADRAQRRCFLNVALTSKDGRMHFPGVAP